MSGGSFFLFQIRQKPGYDAYQRQEGADFKNVVDAGMVGKVSQ
jgi:hypothetical protein